MTSQSDLKLQQIISALKNEFHPSRLFLFGSRASNTFRPDSDYDLVMVVPELKNRHSAEIKARSLILNSLGVSADIFIYSEKDFEKWKSELSSIPETALNTGKEIDLG
jgi:predicted nucleotidyltransferase